MSQEPATAVLLRALCLTTMGRHYELLATRAVQEGWSHAQYLRQLCEVELAERQARNRLRRLTQAALPASKTLESLDQQRLPLKVQRQLATLLEGDFVERAENVLAFGLPGRGKTHLLCALARELVLRHDRRVLFTPTSRLVEQLLQAKQRLELAAKLRQLDRFDVVVLDTSATSTRTAPRWKCSSPSSPSATSGAAS